MNSAWSIGESYKLDKLVHLIEYVNIYLKDLGLNPVSAID